MKIKFDNSVLISISIILVFFSVVFGFSGLRWVIGMALLFFLPYYLILDTFDLDKDEKVIFSFFIGLGLTPSIVYYINLMLPSFRNSIIITFVIITLISLSVRFYFRKKTSSY